jgi:arylsulfatase A-like enzyme
VIDGRDISGLLLGTGAGHAREAHYYFRGTDLEAVRDGRWKLAVTPQAEGVGKPPAMVPASMDAPRLYDLDADVGERIDVAAAHPEVVERLRGLAARMRAELCGPKSPGRRPAGEVAAPAFLYPVADK